MYVWRHSFWVRAAEKLGGRGPLLFLVPLFFALILAVPMLLFQSAHGQTSGTASNLPNTSGYAWSDNIGWVSFSCLNEIDAATSCRQTRNYGVSVAGLDRNGNGLDGPLKGYAWSDNIGWISFGCDGGNSSGDCVADDNAPYPQAVPDPSASGSNQLGPKLWHDPNGNQFLLGWARACSVFASGCSGPLKLASARGGWDGWISLSNTQSTNPYGVQVNGSQFGCSIVSDCNSQSFAWGSTVVGWLDFHPWHNGSFQGTGVRVGYPDLSITCSVAGPNGQSFANVRDTVTWTAHPSGGNLNYSYRWHFDNPQPTFVSGSTDSSKAPGVLYVTPSTSPYNASVDVSDNGGVDWIIGHDCLNHSGTKGITINSSTPYFSLSVRPALNVSFVNGTLAEAPTTNPAFAVISVLPQNNFKDPYINIMPQSVIGLNATDATSPVINIGTGDPANLATDKATVFMCVDSGSGCKPTKQSSVTLPINSNKSSYPSVRIALSVTQGRLSPGTYNLPLHATSTTADTIANEPINIDISGSGVQQF